MTKAMPSVSGRPEKKASSASTPPAEAPMPATTNGVSLVDVSTGLPLVVGSMRAWGSRLAPLVEPQRVNLWTDTRVGTFTHSVHALGTPAAFFEDDAPPPTRCARSCSCSPSPPSALPRRS